VLNGLALGALGHSCEAKKPSVHDFALAFFALGFRWIKLGPGSHSDLLWLSSYFGFSAICMLGLGLRLNSLRAAVHRVASNPLPTG
jgi:hypothetical protein